MLWAKEALLVLAALEAWETDSLGVAKEIGIGCAYSGGYPFSISGDIRSVPS